MSIAKIVKETRRKEHLSLSEMGEALGVTRQTVHQWEKDVAPPGVALLIRTSKNYEDWRREFALACLNEHPALNHR